MTRTVLRYLLLAAVLLVSASPVLHGSAYAQTKRMHVFVNAMNPQHRGELWHIWSDDNGQTFSGWHAMPVNIRNGCNFFSTYGNGYQITFSETPAVISDRPGRFYVVAREFSGALIDNVYTEGQGWSGWCGIPNQGMWDHDESPALASWGPGRVDLFVNKFIDGGKALMHTWAENGVWSGNWVKVGTGSMTGSPAAASWGPNRIDVFVRGGGNELAHKSFANGRWSRSWEDLGTPPGPVLASSPTVASAGPNLLSVYATGSDGQLWQLRYGHQSGFGWDSWQALGGTLTPGDAPTPWGRGVSPTAAARAHLKVDVLVPSLDFGPHNWFWNSYEYATNAWSGYRYLGYFASTNVAVTYWFPFP
jgi:hypothetical protein